MVFNLLGVFGLVPQPNIRLESPSYPLSSIERVNGVSRLVLGVLGANLIQNLDKKYPHLSECAGLRDEVVDGVCGDPDHGGEAHADAHGLGPLGVGVVLAVPHRLVGEDVEYEDSLQKIQIYFSRLYT